MLMALDFLKLLKTIEENRMDVFSTSELAGMLGVPSSSIQNYLETLANNELITRIEKGKYCRIYVRDKFVIGSSIVDGGVISHQSALAYHGIDEDVPGEVYISSSRQKSSKTIFGNHFNFIRIRPHKNFGSIMVNTPNGTFRVTDTEKTLLDCFDLPKYVTSYIRLMKKLITIPMNQDKLLDYGFKMNNLSILKRMAYLLDEAIPDRYTVFLEEVKKNLNLKYTLLDPGGGDTGPFITKWRIRNNTTNQ
jgi:predicted transcriptional regulator of viral defense system